MAKGLYISRDQLEKVINANCTLTNIKIMNESQGFYRYHVEKDYNEFYINVYYTKKRGTTITANCENGQELEQAIINSIEYKEVRNGSFSANMSKEFFDSLVDLLRNLPSVSVSDPEDKGNNGIIYKVKTDFGDSVTLTYFQSTSRMLYQGLLMKLYSIIKSYLLTLNNTISETELGEQALEDKVQQHIKTHFPKGWSALETTVQGFVKDSFTLVEVNAKLSDYAAWVMPVIRVLEYRIKKICLDYSVMIEDSKGFKYYDTVTNRTANIFNFSSSGSVIGVNSNISSMPEDAKDIIVECYDFLRKNRHEMFHATQILVGMKLVETKEEALQIIIETSEKVEKSLVYNTIQLN
ncbi:type II toxin-antitoxin system RnlA family toxin [Oceanobacillus profundus]|uniref:type II toxin-antitoxin system RnlA family toxin n=1 Tax=Oceanobacillus profundus TaxID=372463 RepID=UPI0036306FC7